MEHSTCIARCQLRLARDADDRDRLAQLPCELLTLDMLLCFKIPFLLSGDTGMPLSMSSWSER